MTTFAALLKNDIRLFLKDWKACVLLLAAPVVFISFFMYALSPYLDKSSFIEPFPIAIVDNENTTQTRILINQFEEISIFSEIRRMDEPSAVQSLKEGGIGGIVIIPADFTNSIAMGENNPATVIGNGSKPLQALILKNIAQSAASLVTAAQGAINTIWYYDNRAGITGDELDARFNSAVMEYMLQALARTAVFLEADTGAGSDLTPAEYFTAALIAVFMMFAGMPGVKMMVTERSEGITLRLAASPVGMWKVVLSKLMVTIMLIMVQFGIIILMTSKIFNNYWGAPIKDVLMLFFGIVLAVGAWSVFIASISKTPAAADIIGNLGILLMAVIGGSIYPLSSMPAFVRDISVVTINRWAMDGFMVLFSGNSLAHTGTHALVLVVMGFVMFGSSAVVMRLSRRR